MISNINKFLNILTGAKKKKIKLQLIRKKLDNFLLLLPYKVISYQSKNKGDEQKIKFNINEIKTVINNNKPIRDLLELLKTKLSLQRIIFI